MLILKLWSNIINNSNKEDKLQSIQTTCLLLGKKITFTKSKNIRPLTSTPFQPLKHVFSGCQSVPRLKCQNKYVSVKICVFLKRNMSRAYFAVDWKKKTKMSFTCDKLVTLMINVHEWRGFSSREIYSGS